MKALRYSSLLRSSQLKSRVVSEPRTCKTSFLALVCMSGLVAKKLRAIEIEEEVVSCPATNNKKRLSFNWKKGREYINSEKTEESIGSERSRRKQ
jgi:hypothetical protein